MRKIVNSKLAFLAIMSVAAVALVAVYMKCDQGRYKGPHGSHQRGRLASAVGH